MNRLRNAQPADVPALQALIVRSARALSIGFYTPEQTEALLKHVFGVDSLLIEDQTYFVIEMHEEIVACGGWSRRATLFGGDQAKTGADPMLDPTVDPARIRAFFVDPRMARRRLGHQLLAACTEAARAAGFRSLELASTMPGEPFYAACGFTVVERFDLSLPDGIRTPLARMRRMIG
jgi:N-acetylglutamate synthase-like GNAT family acetyltransferase